MSTQGARRTVATPSAVRGIARVIRPLERERRRHPVLLGVAVGLLLVVLVAWTRYDPVVNADAGACPAGARLQPAGSPGGADEVCSFSNTRDVAVRLEATLANDGVVPVTVTGVNLGGDIQDSLAVTAVRLDGQPLDATRLGRGARLRLEVDGRLPPCGEVTSGRVLVFRQLALRTRVLGLPRDSYVTLAPPVQLIVSDC